MGKGLIELDNTVEDIDINTTANIDKDLFVIRPPETTITKKRMNASDFLSNLVNMPLDTIKLIDKNFSKCQVRMK
jgi:hypothetical protein